MSAVSYSLEHVETMIDVLEKKIENGEVTQVVLGAWQKWLDTVDAMHHEHPKFSEYYSRMLELQTLIYGESNEEEKALEFMKEAVRACGSVGKLYSRLLRQYIASHSQPALVPVPVAVVDDAPVEPAESAESNPLAENYSKHASRLHVRPKSTVRAMKIGAAAAFGLAVISVAGLHFVPRVAALPMLLTKHSQIDSVKQKFDALTTQYSSCSSKLASERGSIDQNDLAAVASFNNDTANCQSILQQQHQAAARYNALVDAK